ncbi:MAG: nicotinate-nucleotide adenylyltransferase [Proteobacteria bacterium]|nr:nicotinate-nucleotide adenylyltransferase [Pseudomonadota bacterium]MBI3499513.1 nicotinate-nucleotide adenylyltransferase [Pseudomonadota bacterium]
MNQARTPSRRRRRKRPLIGLLGGSFNPAHDGHRHISLLAIHLLGLDQVWWLVSPQNPLKPSRGMAPFAQRLAMAAKVAHHPRIKASDFEARLGSIYTADTLFQLKRRYPRRSFVWIMGADNLLQIPRWRRWTRIFNTMPVAIFARAPYSNRALAGLAARRFWRSRVDARHARRLTARPLPAWVFLHTSLSPESATAIRRARSQAGMRTVRQPGSGARGLTA